ncbi:MAG: hypothetical protein QOE70_1912 [Chthoniobacter sp.]|jgi:uncharacterized protein (TIGR02596 family)|nr:hypothetical protein [Chthoniobacter sp.]
MNTLRHSLRTQRAFSLIELVVVIAIIVIIAAFTVPAANTILRGSQLSQSSGLLVGQLSLARQQAMTRNHPIEVRFYRYGDPEVPGESEKDPSTGKFRAIQLFEVQDNGVALPIDKPQTLPNSIIFAFTEADAGLSSIIDAKTAGPVKKPGTKDDPTAPRLPRGVDLKYEFVAFRFMSDGSTNLAPTGNWFLTLININPPLSKPNEPPPNFFTVQVDPVSGSTRSFRPTVG